MAVTVNGSAGVTTNSGAVYDGLQAATVQNSTSGTSIDFTGIPSWAKRVTVMFQGVSTSGTSPYIMQLGTSGGIVTSGYLGSCNAQTNSGFHSVLFTNGFGISPNTTVTAATNVFHGAISVFNLSSNNWVASGITSDSVVAKTFHTSGSIALSGTLTQLRITTSGGTDTFDAGSINILYE